MDTEQTGTTTREQVLATALELFDAQGYDGTSLRQIAERMGFSKAALYYHFPAKDHLVIELVRPCLDAISNLLALQPPHGDIDSHRDRLLADYVDLLITHHAILRFLYQDVGAQQHPDVGRRARSLVLALEASLLGPDAGEAERVRVACALGAVHAVITLDSSSLPLARDVVLAAAQRALSAP